MSFCGQSRLKRWIAAKRIFWNGLKMRAEFEKLDACKELLDIIDYANMYCWLRDNGHLNDWWSVDGPKDRGENIDADIRAAMKCLCKGDDL